MFWGCINTFLVTRDCCFLLLFDDGGISVWSVIISLRLVQYSESRFFSSCVEEYRDLLTFKVTEAVRTAPVTTSPVKKDYPNIHNK